MTIIISNTAGAPIYEQVKQQLRQAIVEGSLLPGEQLPSIRQLAKELKISVITTNRAYGDLEQEGFIAGVPGKGFFVLAQNEDLLREEKRRQVEEAFAAGFVAAEQGALSASEVYEIWRVLWKESSYGNDTGDAKRTKEL